MSTYHRPKTVEEALAILDGSSGKALPYAGGTDIWPRWSKELIERPGAIIDLKHINELKGIARVNGEVSIGTCTLMTELETDSIIRDSAPVLSEAAGRIACPQIRNRATIGGNLCNASPAADSAVPLILLDAVVELTSLNQQKMSVREVPICDFFRGPGSTDLATGEILTRIRFKPLPEGVFAAWDKFGTRPAMEIAVASVGVALKVEAGKVANARVGYGSVAPIPLRGRKTEAELIGNPLTTEVIGKCESAARNEISPISDVRASKAYRREVVGVTLRRMLERAEGA